MSVVHARHACGEGRGCREVVFDGSMLDRSRLSLCFDPARRRFLGGGAAAVLAAGCGYEPPETGAAYAPWDFPDADLGPRVSLVHAASLAASPHNTQPWWFSVGPDRIDLSILAERTLGAMDPLGREQVIGIGCALENLVIAAPSFGFSATVVAVPDANRPELLARIELAPAQGDPHPLFDTIAHRRTNRGPYGDFSLPPDVAGELVALAEIDPAVRLHLLTDADRMQAFRNGTNAATEAIVNDDEMWDASHAWWRHRPADIEEHRDGLTMDLLGVGAGTRVAGKLSRPPTAERAGRYWIRNTERIQLTASAFGILSTPELEDVPSLLSAGRAWQRVHLWIAGQGGAAQPLNQMAERRDREHELDLPPEFGDRLGALADGHAQMLFRVGYPIDDAFASPRRPVDWISEVV